MQAVSVGELNGLPIEEQLAGARQNAKSAELNDRIATRAYRVLGGARWTQRSIGWCANCRGIDTSCMTLASIYRSPKGGCRRGAGDRVPNGCRLADPPH